LAGVTPSKKEGRGGVNKGWMLSRNLLWQNVESKLLL